MASPTAQDLRSAFRAIPREHRDAHQSFSIRVWRALSWLERVEQATEIEDQFIASWIAFNALYGRLDENNRAWGDREAMGTFLATVWRLDSEEHLRRFLGRRQVAVLRLVESKYLYERFWLEPGRNHDHTLHEAVRGLMLRFGRMHMLPVLQALFDRLYVMRNQVFHGASTKGSRLNRRTLASTSALLREALPLLIGIMIEHGLTAEWGSVTYPPIRQEGKAG